MSENKTVAEIIIEQINIIAEWNNKTLPEMNCVDFIETVRSNSVAILDLVNALVSIETSGGVFVSKRVSDD